LSNVWKSNLHKGMKLKLLRAAVESILLYGSATLSERIKARLNICENFETSIQCRIINGRTRRRL